MYVGHFAAALVIKARVPKAPTWGLLIGVGVLDLVFGPLVVAGVERVSVTPGIAPGFSLDHIDWSHSVVMSAVWSAAYALLFWRHGRPVALAMGAAVLSHFVLDLVVHPPDLALWPGAGTHLGLGLWRSLPVGWWFVELAFIAAGFGYYWRRSQVEPAFGGRPWGVAAVLALLHLFNSPWLSMV
ncbi:MAG: permease [Gemmatimonadales bacterium]